MTGHFVQCGCLSRPLGQDNPPVPFWPAEIGFTDCSGGNAKWDRCPHVSSATLNLPSDNPCSILGQFDEYLLQVAFGLAIPRRDPASWMASEM